MDFGEILFSGLRSAFGPTAAAYALLAIGLNMHYGFTGLLNFGQVGFMLVGAYGVGITVATLGWSMWIGIVVGMLAAVVLALVLGIPTLRLRSDYFAITTIAVAEVLRLLVRSSAAEPVTGGSASRAYPSGPWRTNTASRPQPATLNRSTVACTVRLSTLV